MAKCEKCGSGRMSWWSGGIKFKDKKYICVKCLKELGHEHPLKDASILALQTSEDILHLEIRWAREDVLLLEYKGEPQIKWIRLSDDPDNKIRFGQLSKLNALADRIVAIYQSNE